MLRKVTFLVTLCLVTISSMAGIGRFASVSFEPSAPQNLVQVITSKIQDGSYSISGTIIDNQGNFLKGVSVSDGAGEVTSSNDDGSYQFNNLPTGEYTITPDSHGYTFIPPFQVVDLVDGDSSDISFTGTPFFTLSGNAGIGGVTLSYTDGQDKTATSQLDGSYSFTVSYNWSGIVTPSLAGYTFEPPNREYASVSADQTGQDYSPTPITYTISGNAGMEGVILSYTDGIDKSATAGSGGNYSFTVSYNYSGMVTPSLAGYIFSPPNRGYNYVLSDQLGQDYAALPAFTISGTVIDNMGLPVQGVILSVDADHTTSTDENGNYLLTGLVAGSYTLTPNKNGYVFSPDHFDFTLGPSIIQKYFIGYPAYSISGTVVDNFNNELQDVTVTVQGDNKIVTTLTGQDGTYTVASLKANTYQVTVTKDEYDFSPPSRSVTLGPQKDGIDFLGTQRTYSISGFVFDSLNKAVSGVTITALPGSASSMTDSNGAYQIINLVKGSYQVAPSSAGVFLPAVTSVKIGPDSAADIDFTQQIFQIYLSSVASVDPTVIFFDNFITNTGWKPIITTGGESGIMNGEYRLYHSKPNQFLAAIAPLSASQFPTAGYIIQADMRLQQGSNNRLGFVFDWQSAQQFQYFAINPLSHQYWVYQTTNGINYKLIAGGISLLINSDPGATNILKLVRQQNNISIYVNGNLLASQILDAKSTKVQVGLVLSVYDTVPGEARFGRFSIRSLP